MFTCLKQLLSTSLLLLFFVGNNQLIAKDADPKPLVLKLKWFNQFQFAGYYAAVEKGFYAEEGLNVVIEERDVKTNPIDDVLNGKADFGISDSSLILSKLNGSPVVALAVIMQSSPLVLMSLAEKEIISPLDLVNKRVMYQRDIDDAIIVGMLNEVNIKETDFTFVPHNFDDDALLKGDVDVMSAYVTNQPFIYRAKGYKINIINPANYGIDFYGDNLFTSEKMIKENPDQVLAFRRASLKGWQYALENSDEIIDLILKKYQTKSSKEALKYEANLTRRMIKPKLVEIGNINPSRFKRIAEIYKEKGQAPSMANLAGLDYLEHFQPKHYISFILTIASVVIVLIVFILLIMLVINRRLKLAVKARTQELEAANENMAKVNLQLKKLMGFVAHDLRNPLGAIQSLSNLVAEGKFQNKLPEVLQQINIAAAKGLELVKSALEATALGTGKYEMDIQPFDLSIAISNTTQTYQNLANSKNVTIQSEIKPQLFVLGDINRISQVFDNIILNAVKYAMENSAIILSTSIEKDKVSIKCINHFSEKTNLSVNEDELYQSFGFGLEIIKEILELHKSSLKLTTQDNVFIVSFTLMQTK